MNAVVPSNLATSRLSAIATMAVTLALGTALVLQSESVASAATGEGAKRRAASTVVRDHRTPRAEPLVRDHRNGVKVRDHRGSLDGGKRRVPCLGNLC